MYRKHLAIVLILIQLICFSISFGQNPPPPPGQHNLSGDQPPQGGNAPIGTGTVLLVVMGVVYGLSRSSGLKKDTLE